MPRCKKKPLYNPDVAMETLVKSMARDFGNYDDRRESRQDEPSLNEIALEYNVNPLKARKILITAGVYSTALSRTVAKYARQGKSVKEIMELTELSRASVNSYLPYKGYAYNMQESSVDADRAKRYRKRNRAVEELVSSIELKGTDVAQEKELLWKCVERFEGFLFKTAKGLPVSYEIKRNKDGRPSGELIFSRKEKGVTKATVELAYDRVVAEREGQGVMIPILKSPKMLM